MAAVSTCNSSPTPCLSLPLFVGPKSPSAGPQQSTTPSALPPVPSSLERRLRALRRMSESSGSLRENERGGGGNGSSSSPVATPPRRVVSGSALDRLEAMMADADCADADPFTTPRIFHAAPLETPPTPGCRKRPIPVGNADDLPSFLPVGIRARATASSSNSNARLSISANAASSSCSSTGGLPERWASAPSSPKRLRTAPRYECPWLASFAARKAEAAAAAAHAAASEEAVGGGGAQGKASEAAAAAANAAASSGADSQALLGALQDAARVLEISAHRRGGGGSGKGSSSGSEGEASDLSDDDDDEDRPEEAVGMGGGEREPDQLARQS